MSQTKKLIVSLFSEAGITINGQNSFDIQIHNEDFYNRILKKGVLGLGESYMDGWWDCKNLDQFFCKIILAELDKKVKQNWITAISFFWHYFINSGKKSKAFEIGKRHYDIGNDLYNIMLDKRLTYTCGYWKNAKNLDEAEEAKLDLVCKKIGLKSGQRILDIGSGWGSFMGFSAKKYGANIVGITVSKEQKILADKLYKNLSVKTRLQDYRDINEKFDHIISLGMFEHVGVNNYHTFMKIVSDALKDDGLFLLHTIGTNQSGQVGDPWFDKYIFPGGKLPSVKQIAESVEDLFVIEDLHNFGADYDKTLMAWHKNFEDNWYKIKSNYDQRFYRMWRYYLLMSAGAFRSRKIQLWQIVFSKKGVTGGYKRVS